VTLPPIKGRPIRGPRAVAVAQGGWPMSNLKIEGCKHDIYGGDEELLDAGHVVPCAKCGATLLGPGLAKRLAAEVWEDD
jgi:hypothetical protein